jgi:signal transduction histidine kinase
LEREAGVKEFRKIFAIPLILGFLNSAFYRMAVTAFYGHPDGAGGLSGRVYGKDMFDVKTAVYYGIIILLLYFWLRPATKYAEEGDEASRLELKRRLANIYRDAFRMIFALQAGLLIFAAFSSVSLSWVELTAAGIALFCQAAFLVVQIDSHLAKQKKLIGSLYSPEELGRLKPGASISIHTKLSMIVAAFAVLPFLLIAFVVYRRVPWEIFYRELFMMLFLSAGLLLAALRSIYDGIQTPLDGLIARMSRVSSGDYAKSRIYFSDEVAKLKAGFNSMVDGLSEREKKLAVALGETSRLESELAVSKATSDLAAQVAHDIRSPLAALGAAAKKLEMPEDQRLLVEDTVARLRGIADDLLSRYKAPGSPSESGGGNLPLSGLVERVVAEKRLQLRPGQEIRVVVQPGSAGKAWVSPKEFQRIVSNLINNSLEALPGKGEVVVSVGERDGMALLEIKDNGKGIPAEVLARLGAKGETHGKAGGTGLGLYHARSTVEGWGGWLTIASVPGEGTSVTLAIPAASNISGPIFLLDNDLLVHMTWRAAANAAGIELKVCKDPEELKVCLKGADKKVRIYIDSDLGNGLNGEDVAKELHGEGFSNLSMATGHSPDKFSGMPWLQVTGKEPPWGP